MNLAMVLSLIGLGQCIFLVMVLLIIRKPATPQTRTLGFSIAALGLIMLDIILTQINWNHAHLLFLAFTQPAYFLAMPLLFFYIRFASGDPKAGRGRITPHLIPAAILFLLLAGDALMSLTSNPQSFPQPSGSIPERYSGVNYFWFFIGDFYQLTYLALSWRAVRRNQHRQNLSKNGNMNFNLLNGIVTLLLAILVLTTLSDFLLPPKANLTLTPFLLTIFVYAIALMGFKEANFFLTHPLVFPGKKYEKSSLPEETAQHIISILKEKMEKEKRFIDPLINLNSLAQEMGTSSHILSQLLNEKLQKSFFTLLSEYRIQEAKKRIKDLDPKKITLNQIAYDVGFNSLSTFNSTFKKMVGVTPSKFREFP